MLIDPLLPSQVRAWTQVVSHNYLWAENTHLLFKGLATDCFPIHPRLLGRSGFKPCHWHAYFLLQLSDCILMAGVLVH